MARWLLALVVAVTVTIGTSESFGQNRPPSAGDAGAPLVVATRIIPPFVMREGGSLSGFSIDLWSAIAREMNVRSRFEVVETLPRMLDVVESEAASVAIAAISITAEREQRFDFSVSMFEAGLQIAVRREAEQDLFSTIGQVIGSPALYEFIALLLGLAAVPAALVWLFERRHTEGIVAQGSRSRGLFKALWWSTSALGGQAEEMPVSVGGRLVAVVWLFVALLLTTSFIAVVTTSMTVGRLKGDIAGPRDLAGKKVATVAGSTSDIYLRGLDVDVRTFARIEEAYRSLEAGDVQALVYDSPVLQYHLANEGDARLRLVETVFRKQSYGLLFRPGDPLRKRVNAALLRLRESGEYDAIYQRWFGVSAAASR